MPSRIDDFNKKFVYTETNPEGIISAKKGAFFYRRGTEFYLNRDGNLEVGFWEKLPYKTVIIPPPPASKLIKYKRPHEIWLKTTNGFYNDQEVLMPKTGWERYSYEDAFALQLFRKLNWIFPPPISSYDPMGGVGSRSYDLNYFYAKIDGVWYRTPITTWYDTDNLGVPDDPNLTTYLPYVDMPRSPVGVDWTVDIHCAIPGDQSYDNSFFYIKVDQNSWRRARLNIYANTYKMALF
jgi:hypothetical protein